ncbi:hypothetical protein AAHB58_09970 [Enterobacter hormaechei]
MSNIRKSKHDLHPFDLYIKWLANRIFMIGSWIVVMALGLYLSEHYSQWSILPRFGAIGIMIGTLLTLSPLFADGIYLSQSEAFSFGSLDDEGKTRVTTEEGRKVSINIFWG